MTNKDGTLADDNISEEEIEVKVESEVDGEVDTDTDDLEEDTSHKNVTSKPKSQDGKRSAGQVIAELGNEKKAIAAQLVTLAKTSESSRQEVKKMLIADPSTATYLKTKFGTDYDLIIGDTPITEDKVDIEKLKEQARAQAQAEAIKVQIQTNHEKMLTEKAASLGFTSEELETYREKVELLGGDDKAMEDAALIVNYAKATAKKGEYADGGAEADKPKKKQVTITPGLSDYSDSQRLDKKEFATELHRVKSLHRVDSMGKPIMDLPALG